MSELRAYYIKTEREWDDYGVCKILQVKFKSGTPSSWTVQLENGHKVILFATLGDNVCLRPIRENGSSPKSKKTETPSKKTSARSRSGSRGPRSLSGLLP